jgi:hypothetical protein
MIRIALGIVAAVCAAACGGSASHDPAHTSTRPPAATLTGPSGTRTLATGSYCWTASTGSGFVGGCGDSGDPALIPGLPRVRVHLGDAIVVHLRFTPTAPVDASIGPTRYRLPAGRTLHLRVRGGGVLTLDPRSGGDDVEYLARIVIAS